MKEQISTLVSEARQLLKTNQFSSAIKKAQLILESDPNHREGLYLLAVSHRYLNHLDKALNSLKILQKHHADFGRGFQEQGHCYRAQGNAQKALSAYMSAVQANPTLLASWQMIVTYQSNGGDQQIAAIASEKVTLLGRRNPLLNSVESMVYEGHLAKAETLCRQYLEKRPQDTEAMRLLAFIGTRLNILDDAEFLLESALKYQPKHVQARYDYVNVLHRRQKYKEAVKQSKTLLDSQPHNLSFKILYANEAVAVGQLELALELYEDALAAMPDNANLHLVYGHALKTIGEQERAIKAYQNAYQYKADFGDAYWSLANLKTYQFSDDELAQMKSQAASMSITNQDRYHLLFALGKAHEDRQEYEDSFSYYQQGNRLKKDELNYSAERMEQEFERQKQYVSQALIEKYQGCGSKASDPIFIVGLPRAGSTLLEQILASHSQIDGTFELPNILAFVHQLNGRMNWNDEPLYPKNLHDMAPEKYHEYGERYIKETKIHRQAAPYFIDKMPNNFRHIGLIKLILPNAKIIDARRNPMDCCFSGFKQLFAEGQEFSYSLEDIARYYQGYVELMAHWDSLFPEQILRVQYEDVVSDFENQVARIFAYLELPLEDNCLSFYQTRRQVRTASSEQVRQPINKAGLERWRPYAPYLDPLKAVFEL